MASNTSGGGNAAFGNNALGQNNGGSNTAVGSLAAYNATAADHTTAVGWYAFNGLTSGDYNVGLGGNTGLYNQTGAHNTFVGYAAGKGTSNYTNSNYNTMMGSGAAINLSSGADENSLFGALTGNALTTGDYNLLLGAKAGYSLTTGNSNVFIGHQAGYNETGSNLLYIDNSNTSSPLIKGDFSSNTLEVNGKTTIKDVININPSATPSSPVKGDVYFDSTSNKLRCYDGSSWNDLF
jgi:hypothetical protein